LPTDSQLVKATRRWIQGCNAQAAVNERQIVISAEVSVDSPDFGHLEPMVDAAERELEQNDVTERPEVVVADAGYWHQAQLENFVCRGVKVLIPPDSRQRKGARAGWGGGAYAFMRRVLQTGAGRELYRKRQAMLEPVFAHTKFNRRIDRLQRRGRARDHHHSMATARHPSSLRNRLMRKGKRDAFISS
jgi:Transposase DDE domain